MKFSIGVLVFLLGTGLVAVPLAKGQSLAEIAKEEKERRKKLKSSGKVITDQDLKRGKGTYNPPAQAAPSPASSATPAAGSGSAAGGETEKTTDELREERRVEIQGKIDEEVKVIAAIRERQESAQLELNDLSNLTYGPRRANLQKVIDDGEAEIAKVEQTIKDLQQEARRAGVRVSRP